VLILTLLCVHLLSAPAEAVRPVPEYRAELAADLGAVVSDLNTKGHYRQAIQEAGRITRAVERFALVAYEAGYAHYHLGELDAAARQYDQALALDPHLAAAHYDRGEIALAQGDLERAQEHFQAVVRLRPQHWAGHFRLAHLAGLAGTPAALHTHLSAAIGTGFELENLLVDPDWRAFSRDPVLGPVLRKLVVLYGDETILLQLKRTP
jgi:tetratricopeptide (TPR) repeat protein